MATIKTTRLYRMRADLTRHEFIPAYVAGIRPDTIYWLDGNRQSSLGGYIGNFRGTYQHSGNMLSPSSEEFRNLPMDYFEEVYTE